MQLSVMHPITTMRPLKSLPVFSCYHHQKVNTAEYESMGKYRKNEHHCVFHYTLAGRGEFFAGKKAWQITQGLGFLHVINQENAGYRYPADGKEPWEFICISMEWGSVRKICREMATRYGPVFRLPLGHPALQALFAEARWEGKEALPAQESAALVAGLLQALLASAQKKEVLPQIILDAKRLTEARAEGNLTVQELAVALHVSREHLSRQFARYTGRSISAYIEDARMQKAMHLLKESNLPIQEVAWRLGFSSVSNFSRALKRKTGLSPSSYRQNGFLPVASKKV